MVANLRNVFHEMAGFGRVKTKSEKNTTAPRAYK